VTLVRFSKHTNVFDSRRLAYCLVHSSIRILCLDSAFLDSFPTPLQSSAKPFPLLTTTKMPHITDLPSEILAQCAKYLQFRDLISVMSTCHDLHESMKTVSVEQINWLPHTPFRRRPLSVAFDGLVRGRNGRRLANNLLVYSAIDAGLILCPQPLAACVVRLGMRAVCPARCPHNASCGLTYKLFRALTGLKDLTINVDFFQGDLLTLRLPEKLEALRLYSCTKSPRLKFIQSVCNLHHPSLRRLNLTDLHIHWSEQELCLQHIASRRPGPNSLNLPKLESLVLINVQTRASVLGLLFRQWRNFQRLWYMVRLDAETHPSIPAGDAFSLATLGANLQPLKSSLIEFYLICRPERTSHRQPMGSCGLLPHLRDFSSLELLSIDPAVLIGVETCMLCMPSLYNNRIIRLSDFARMIPSKLQHLGLVINLEQAGRFSLRHYRSDVLEGILSLRREQTGLVHLKKLAFVEDVEYASRKRCRPTYGAGNRHDCYFSRDLATDDILPFEEAKLRRKISECEGLGIVWQRWTRRQAQGEHVCGCGLMASDMAWNSCKIS
jgi:hypothetical protein